MAKRGSVLQRWCALRSNLSRQPPSMKATDHIRRGGIALHPQWEGEREKGGVRTRDGETERRRDGEVGSLLHCPLCSKMALASLACPGHHALSGGRCRSSGIA